MILAFLILGCLAGLRFTPPALAWIVPAAALGANLAGVAGLGTDEPTTLLFDVAAVQFGYFIGCCLATAGGFAIPATHLALQPDSD